MKRLLAVVFVTLSASTQIFAQSTTTGGGPSVSVQDTGGTRTVKDTTSHTTLSNGVTISTSTGSDGKPNGGVRTDPPAGPGGASYEGH